MKLREIQMTNFRKFKNLAFTFPDEKILVLTGENGSGKSSILDAIAKCFAHYIGKLISYSDRAHHIEDKLNVEDITNGKPEVSVHCVFGNDIDIKISKKRDQKGSNYNFDENYFRNIRNKLLTNESVNLPLMVYYRVNRTVALSKRDEEKPSNGFYHPIFESYAGSIDPHGTPFSRFDNWFIQRENLENEMIKQKKDFDFQLPELAAFRKITSKFLSFFYKEHQLQIEVSRMLPDTGDPMITDPGKVFITLGNKKNPVMLSQLSSGEKMVFYIVADIAQRLLILNGGDTEFEKHQGIVLIDEVGLHLHPQWQRQILPSLHHVFPRIQFICTTHSPQVISSLEKNNVLKVKGQCIFLSSSDPKGGESSRILEETFDTRRRPEIAQNLIEEIFRLLESEEIDFDMVDSHMEQLHKLISSDDPELLRIKNYMKRRKLLMS